MQPTAPDLFSQVFSVAFFAWLIASTASLMYMVWFLHSVAPASESRIDRLFRDNHSGLSIATCRSRLALTNRKPSVVYILTFIGTPWLGYAYLGRPGLALLSFFTLGGLGIWWVVSLFTLPYAALAHNEQCAVAIASGREDLDIFERGARWLHTFFSRPTSGSPKRT